MVWEAYINPFCLIPDLHLSLASFQNKWKGKDVFPALLKSLVQKLHIFSFSPKTSYRCMWNQIKYQAAYVPLRLLKKIREFAMSSSKRCIDMGCDILETFKTTYFHLHVCKQSHNGIHVQCDELPVPNHM